jgi:malonyl-CoA/methylmalonyl-CoA synthetase
MNLGDRQIHFPLLVLGVPHPDFGEAVVAVCEATDAHKAQLSGPHPLSAGEKEQLRKLLAPYKIPKAVHFMPLPRNHLGLFGG